MTFVSARLAATAGMKQRPCGLPHPCKVSQNAGLHLRMLLARNPRPLGLHTTSKRETYALAHDFEARDR